VLRRGRDVTRKLRVVVIGAGAAGLTAAARLCETHEVVVVDKGRGVGGRLATRRIGQASFDHGAQFITAHTADFAEVVRVWETGGVVRPWFRGRIGPNGIVNADGHIRYRGVNGLNAVAKHLANGLDVRLGVRVSALVMGDRGWAVRTDSGEALEADAVVLTAPVPQALDLLSAGAVSLATHDREALDAIRYDSCLAVLAPLQGPSGMTEPGAIDPARGPIDWIADNHIKGLSAIPGVTIHATPGYSASHWGEGDDTIAAELLGAAALGAAPIKGTVQVHRWRYARPTVTHPERCLLAEGMPTLIFAGDAFGGAKVEGAVLAGHAAAAAVTRALGDR